MSVADIPPIEHAAGIEIVGDLAELRSKAGISVYRAQSRAGSVIIKLFEHAADRREIANYQLLTHLGIPTIHVLGCGESFIVLEDLEASQEFRLGREEDLGDVQIARSLAEWYLALHDKGARAPGLGSLYAETDLITAEALASLGRRFPQTGTTVAFLLEHLTLLRAKIDALAQTLTYNDFYWDNLAVRRDRSAALMFDYNLLGRGYRYGDIRNVCSSLSPEAGEAFVQTYCATHGDLDPHERALDRLLADLVTLIVASQRPSWPSWATSALHAAENGNLLQEAEQNLG